MLVQFSLTNYRNFKETATLDLSEAKITEFPKHLYRDKDGLRILPMAALYGGNGCGKTNFLEGIWNLRQLVLDAPSVVTESNACFTAPSQAPVEYDILFRIDNREYNYQLTRTPDAIVEENLFGRDLDSNQFNVLFDRDCDGVFLWKKWEDVDVATLPENIPLLYFLGTQTNENELHDIFSYFKNMSFLHGAIDSKEALKEIIADDNSKQELLSHLKNMSFDITNLSLANSDIYLTHTLPECTVELSWTKESFGTCQCLLLLSTLMKARKEHTLVLLDAPETGLHSKTLQYLYRYISQNASAQSKSQVLLATHETSNMNNSIFRRDELWLVAKNEDGSSQLYTLALFLKENGEKVRKDEVYSKQYLEGRYGAIPAITL